MVILFLLVSLILLLYLQYRRKIMHQKYLLQLTYAEHQKNLLETALEAQEEERKRIAVTLHDDTGNRLNVLSLLLENLSAGHPPKQNLNTYVSELISSVRSISHSLYPVNLERLGLILYTEELISLLSEKLTVDFYISGHYEKRSTLVEVQLFRIIQEFSSNVLKHANAAHLKIYLRAGQKGLSMLLADDGRGFDLEKGAKGMGLKNIRTRVASLHAYAKWKSDVGTRLILYLPYDKVSDSR